MAPDRHRQADIVDAEDAPAGLFAGDQTRALKTETTIDALREKFGAGAVVAGRALKPGAGTSKSRAKPQEPS